MITGFRLAVPPAPPQPARVAPSLSPMKTSRSLLAAFVAVSVLTLTAFAADLTGKWTWPSMSKATGPSEIVATLVVNNGVISGTVTSRQGTADITEGSLKGDLLTFTAVRISGNSPATFNYSGQVSGDTITGTIEKTSTGGTPAKTDWKATRAK